MILNLIISLGVIVSAALVTSKLGIGDDFRWWIGFVFFLLLFLASLYEIPIKEGKKSEKSKKQITTEIILFWLFPLSIGIAIGKYYC